MCTELAKTRPQLVRQLIFEQCFSTVVIKQVCTNGVVSFGSATLSTSEPIPQDSGPPFIAVNWFDFRIYHDTEGRVYYRSTSSGIESIQ